jgi:hypothetical protein
MRVALEANSFLKRGSLFTVPLLFGMLLAGCGSDNTPFPTPTTVTYSAVQQPALVNALNPQTVTAGQGTTVTSPLITNPSASGVASLNALIPPGAVGTTQTLAIDVIPTAAGTVALTRANNPGATLPNVLAEITFGAVDTNNKINPQRPVVFNAPITVTIGLNPSSTLSQYYNAVVAGSYVLHVYQNNQGTLTLTTCTAAFTDPQTIVVTGECSGDLLVTADPVSHNQGGVTP